VEIEGPLGAKAHDIAIIYPALALSPNLTVAEYIYLGREPKRGSRVDRAAMTAGCRGLLANLGATFGPTALVADLSIAEQQMVEVARALNANSRILVMDEPTTTLAARETERLLALIRRPKAEGLAIIYISHRMTEVYELAERVSVLRDGGYVGTLTHDEAKPESIVRMMVGRDLSNFYKKEHRGGNTGSVVLEVARRAPAVGIIVVAVDTAAKGADATVTTNNVQAGAIAWQYLVEKMGGKGDMVIVNGPQVCSVTERVKGRKAVLAKSPGIRILFSDQEAKGSRDGGLAVMQSLLTRFPKIDGVFAINDPTGIGVELTATQQHRTSFPITAVDDAPDAEAQL